MSTLQDVKERIAQEVKLLHPRLIEISHAIHENPETAMQEHRAVALLTSELEREGFTIQRPVAGLDTAFVASYGKGTPVVGFLAEYDALRGLGHACGHNLIAVWALGAGIALKRALADQEGTIKVIGTPGEEGAGGKVIMANAGVFGGLDAAIIMHGHDATYLHRDALAAAHYTIEYFGKASHASSAPEKGVSALDAVLQLFFSVNAWRQMLQPGSRVHGCILKGGDAPNIIPEYACAEFLIRARDQAYHQEMKRRFRNIVDAAALATGTTVKVHEGVEYQTRVSNPELLERFRDNLMALGLDHEIPGAEVGVGSSDVGNVSQVVPTINPFFKVCDKGIAAHSPGFREAVISPRADDSIRTGCIAMAWTGADIVLLPEVRERARSAFREQFGRDPQGSKKAS